MRWIYRLQQRVAITRSERNVILGLALLFSLGLAARYLQSRPRPLPEAVYAEAARAFEAASAAPAVGLAQEEEALPAAPAARRASKPSLPAAPFNLNTATSAQLQRLPRIGPKLAQRIIAYREAHGAFERVDDLVRVRGIGKKTLAGIAPFLFVEEAPDDP